MDLHRSILLFVEAANAPSLASAARKIGVSAPTASRMLSDLETWLGAPLIRRTTRQLMLTDLGKSYLPRCAEIVATTQSLQEDIVHHAGARNGSLTVTVSTLLAKGIVAPMVADFMTDYPDINLLFDVSDAQIDIISEGVDLAIRIGSLPDSDLIATKLGSMDIKLVASPDYLAIHGIPTTVQDILNLPCIVDRTPSFGAQWPFLNRHRLNNTVSTNSGDIATVFAIEGLGLAYLPAPYVSKHIEGGTLTEIPTPGRDLAFDIFAVFPPKKYVKPTAREFANRVRARFTHDSGDRLYAGPRT